MNLLTNKSIRKNRINRACSNIATTYPADGEANIFITNLPLIKSQIVFKLIFGISLFHNLILVITYKNYLCKITAAVLSKYKEYVIEMLIKNNWKRREKI